MGRLWHRLSPLVGLLLFAAALWVLGREVRSLIEEPMAPGVFQAEWNGTNNKGELVESGVYLYRLVAGKYVATKKMTLLK